MYGKNNGGIKQNALKVTSKIGNKITRTISNIGSKLIKSISWGTNRFKNIIELNKLTIMEMIIIYFLKLEEKLKIN